MFKIDKSTHLLILFTFAIIFVVVYLYYTIIDVRKIQKELKTLSEDVLALKKLQAQENQATLHEEEQKRVIPIVLATETEPELDFEVDEDESVHTEEVQAVLDVEEQDVSEELPEQELDLSALKYDELRDLCKKLNLNQRGTKEVLLKRLEENRDAK